MSSLLDDAAQWIKFLRAGTPRKRRPRPICPHYVGKDSVITWCQECDLTLIVRADMLKPGVRRICGKCVGRMFHHGAGI